MLNEGAIPKSVGKHKWTIAAVVSRGSGDSDAIFTLGEIHFPHHPLPPARTGGEEEKQSSGDGPWLGSVQAALLNMQGEACC